MPTEQAIKWFFFLVASMKGSDWQWMVYSERYDDLSAIIEKKKKLNVASLSSMDLVMNKVRIYSKIYRNEWISSLQPLLKGLSNPSRMPQVNPESKLRENNPLAGQHLSDSIRCSTVGSTAQYTTMTNRFVLSTNSELQFARVVERKIWFSYRFPGIFRQTIYLSSFWSETQAGTMTVSNKVRIQSI